MDFIGRDALMRQRQEGIKKKFVMLTLDDHDIATDNFPWQGEPILRNGKYVGNVTSSSYGYTLERQVCLGYITNCESADGTVTMSYITDKTANYQVAIGNKLFSATMHAYPPKIVTPDYGFYHPSKKMGT
ncbi:PDPR [Bugula neritina]|uniref:PDPR n=1 Tax=Bugula neritina TaxID=10212 RepID=A0A7J7K084_BUGNE|nr:PDPR [Bugula neritina]